MLLRICFIGAVTFLTVLQTGCHRCRRCCVPCCPTSCSCYQPTAYNEPATFSPVAAKDLPQVQLVSGESR